MKSIFFPHKSGPELPPGLDKLDAGACCCFLHSVLHLLSCYLMCAIGLHYTFLSLPFYSPFTPLHHLCTL